ncbi:thioesterase family protein [Alicyclobacillus sp. SO9]|uniref:acyl-CoA thioesterase n=1 Tax=Alicyclobacillus sp. SO9 TaxID=2665646 RepID=UPI0018E8CB5C|nr:acyl-CoA thioesterase [Alicyclobacillus sp. SO9]
MKHITKIPVRFSDTDMLGHVNNSRYFTYMEESRIDFLQTVVANDAGTIPLIIASAQVHFRAQTFYPQTLKIESWVSRWGNSSFDVTSEMYDEETGTLVFEGVAVLVHFDYDEQKPSRVPEAYREKLLPYSHEG